MNGRKEVRSVVPMVPFAPETSSLELEGQTIESSPECLLFYGKLDARITRDLAGLTLARELLEQRRKRTKEVESLLRQAVAILAAEWNLPEKLVIDPKTTTDNPFA